MDGRATFYRSARTIAATSPSIVNGSASIVTSRPCARAVSLVTGADGRDPHALKRLATRYGNEVLHRRGACECNPVGPTLTAEHFSCTSGRIVRDDRAIGLNNIDHCSSLSEFDGNHIARDGRARKQHPLALKIVRPERTDQRFSHILLRHDIHFQVKLFQGARGGRPDGAEASTQRAQVVVLTDRVPPGNSGHRLH